MTIRKYAEAGDHDRIVAEVSGSNQHMDSPLITIRGEAHLNFDSWQDFKRDVDSLYEEKKRQMDGAKEQIQEIEGR